MVLTSRRDLKMEYSEERLKTKLANERVITVKSKIFHQVIKKLFPYATNFSVSSKINIPVITYKINSIERGRNATIINIQYILLNSNDYKYV